MRKTLDLTALSLANLFQVPEETLKEWETSTSPVRLVEWVSRAAPG